MNQDRAKAAEAALKNVETLKKTLVKPNSSKAKTVVNTGPTKIQASGLPEPVAGTGFVQYIMYFIGGILVLGLVLMVVDKWFFPIFKRSPGAPGYISLPGTDMSDSFWTDLKTINNVSINAPPPPTDSTLPPPNPAPLYSTVLASQSTYTITLDVLINDEKPQDLGPNAATNNISRTFFFLGTALDNNNRKVTFTMDNTMNRVHMNVFNSLNEPKSCVIDNVPVHTPFRIGFVKSSYAMEAYLNGLLVQTIQLKGGQKDPVMGDTIYAPQNITSPPSTDENAKKTAVASAQADVRRLALTTESTAKEAETTAAAAEIAEAAIAAATLEVERLREALPPLGRAKGLAAALEKYNEAVANKQIAVTEAAGKTESAATAARANVAAQRALKLANDTLATAQQGLAAAKATGKVLSTGIQVMNLRLFPYAVMPNEMQARMSDLTDTTIFNPKNTSTSNLNSVSTWWKSLLGT